ncbi:MAG: hypothetical protein ACXV7J_07200 [Methylomonas sp.]
MKSKKILSSVVAAFVATMLLGAPVFAATGVQIGASGKTYASSGIQCALNPITGMAPLVKSGLYNPKQTDSATLSLNATAVATVTFYNPDANVWLANGSNTVVVSLNKRTADSYTFDASLTYPNQPNICIPNTNNNFVDVTNDLETAASGKSSATLTPGCALNPLTGQAQPFVNLLDNGSYLLNVSVNNIPLTQLNGTTRKSKAVFLSAGLNVFSAANGSVSTDYYVRDGGSGSCTLP